MKEVLYDWGGGNVALFHWINDVRGVAIDRFMELGTWLGDHERFPVYLTIAIAVGWFQFERARGQSNNPPSALARTWFATLFVFALAYVVDGLAVSWLKQILNFPRPPLALPLDSLHVVGAPKYEYSLPSGHALFALTITLSLWPVLNKHWRIGMLGFALWVGLSRVSLGVHFPADVLAGYLLAGAIVVTLRFAVRTFASSRTS